MFPSARTMSRRLNAEGSSFRALVDEVRRARSEQLLGHTRMATEQIVTPLGYAESASFIRAFRRWNGCRGHSFPRRTFRAIARAGLRPRSRRARVEAGRRRAR
ncbi:helix-turn-helix domain-containing protein [Nocardia xishanensis]